MNITPIGNRVLIQLEAKEEVTASGIVLPDTVDKEQKAQGKILKLGNGEKLAALNLKENDIVIYSKYAGDDVKVDNVEYKILNHDDILATIVK